MRTEEARIITDVCDTLKWIFAMADKVFRDDVVIEEIDMAVHFDKVKTLIKIKDGEDSWIIYDTDLKCMCDRQVAGFSVTDAKELFE